MNVTIQIPYDTGIPEKLEILRLERGISVNGFIVSALAEKLKRDGYLSDSSVERKKPVRKPKSGNVLFDVQWIIDKQK